jgi:hypothetical protein
MFVRHRPFEATLADEDRARLHQLIKRQLAIGQKWSQVSGTVASVLDRECTDVTVSGRAQPLEPDGQGQRAELSAGSDAALRHGASTEAAFEAEIDVLIKQAGNRLQQQVAKMRDHRDAGRDQAFLPGDKEKSAV